MTLEAIQKVFYGVASLVGVGGVAWLLRTAVAKLIDHLLDRKLAGFKDAQNREIEKLRTELRHIEDRGVRSNEREYQALSLVWDGFIDAYHATAAIGGLRSMPDLDNMNDEDFNSWLETADLSEASKRFITKAQNKGRAFSEIQNRKDVYECSRLIWEGRTALRHQGVFIPENIEQQFEAAFAALSKVWAEQHANLQSRGSLPMTEAQKLISGDGETLRQELRNVVRRRLLHELHTPETKPLV